MFANVFKAFFIVLLWGIHGDDLKASEISHVVEFETDDSFVTQRGEIPVMLQMILPPTINLKSILNDLYIEYTSTQLHRSSNYSIVNADEIGAFLQLHRINYEDLERFRETNLYSLYSEYTNRGENVDIDLETIEGWEVKFSYATVIDNAPLLIKMSPKKDYASTFYKNAGEMRREEIRSAYQKLKNAIRLIPSRSRPEATNFLRGIKMRTKNEKNELRALDTALLELNR